MLAHIQPLPHNGNTNTGKKAPEPERETPTPSVCEEVQTLAPSLRAS
jgi:hypothetical protein